MNVKTLRIVPMMALILLFLSIVLVGAQTGGIRVNPPLPVKLASPADFTVDTIGNDETAYSPHIFLVMTEECYNGLTGDVVVSWSGGSITFVKPDDWTREEDNSVKVPPGTTSGAGYTVASLKDHLSTSGAVYWAFGAFLSDPITNDPQAFTVTLPSTHPRMLVYALGKSSDTAPEFDMRTPPTIPGFVVPEPATILGIAASMTALAGYAIKKRKIF